MKRAEPSICIPVDLTNPGQFFACCGLLELANRCWPGTEGWFEYGRFNLITGDYTDSKRELLKAIIACPFEPLMSVEDRARLEEINRKIRELKKAFKSPTKAEEKRRKSLNSKRIRAGFQIGSPFNMQVDWWLIKDAEGDHLKTWAGQQTIADIAEAIKSALFIPEDCDILSVEKVVIGESDGEPVAPLSFDGGRVGTAQDIGYSPDKVGQAITCCIWTEFLTLIALQRFALRPTTAANFSYYIWREPLPPCVAAVAARGDIPHIVSCVGTFRLAARDSGNRYKAFQQATLTDWRST